VSARRFIVFVLAAYVALIVTASAQALLPWRIPTPEVMLLIVLYLGLGGRGSASSFVTIALVMGYLADLFSGAPKGLHALTLAIAMLLSRAMSSRLLMTAAWHTIAIAFGATLVHSILVVALSAELYGDSPLAGLRVIPQTALTTALLAPLLFSWLRRLDRRLMPDPRALRMA
jgi:rod shape-determining protein MreD